MITAQRGTTCHHHAHAKRILELELTNDGYDKQQYINTNHKESETYSQKVATMARKEYIAHLFIKQVDRQLNGDVKKSFMNSGPKEDLSNPKTPEPAIAIVKR